MNCQIKDCNRKIFKGELCYEHYILYFDIKNYPIDSFYLIHSTKTKDLESILKSGKLLSLNNSGNKSDWIDDENDVYNDIIFTSLIYHYNDERLNMSPEANSIRSVLIFDVKKMYKDEILTNENYLCNEWNFGQFNKKICMNFYENSLYKTLNKWRKFDHKGFLKNNPWYEKMKPEELKSYHNGYPYTVYGSVPWNEIPLFTDELDLKYLVGILIKKNNEITQKLVKKYPKINWLYNLDSLI